MKKSLKHATESVAYSSEMREGYLAKEQMQNSLQASDADVAVSVVAVIVVCGSSEVVMLVYEKTSFCHNLLGEKVDKR